MTLTRQGKSEARLLISMASPPHRESCRHHNCVLYQTRAAVSYLSNVLLVNRKNNIVSSGDFSTTIIPNLIKFHLGFTVILTRSDGFNVDCDTGLSGFVCHRLRGGVSDEVRPSREASLWGLANGTSDIVEGLES